MTTATEAERRKAPRLDAAHPIILEWQARGGELHRARGTTRDIALGGVYCYMERALAAGAPVEFDMVVPGALVGGSPRKLRCRGRVLRSEPAEEPESGEPESGAHGYGVAVTIETSEVVEVLEPTVDAERHRIYARIVPATPIQAEYPGMRSGVRDLSLAGAFIEDERPLPVGRLFKLRLSSAHFSAEIEVDAVVRRVEPHVGMAVEFVALTAEAKKCLQAIVERGGPWRGPQEAFPSEAWQSEEGQAVPVKLDEVVEFVRQRAARALPQLEIVACHYRISDRLFSLHLRDAVSKAELLLPISERWVRDCRVDADCTQMDRAFHFASRILDLKPPPES